MPNEPPQKTEAPPRHELFDLDAALRRVQAIGSYHGIVARSDAMMAVFRKIELYGPAEGPVLTTGETGTGKELVARALHARSPRARRPFVALNCTALNEELFESELFGHEKGAFTGANRQHRGRFERANGGTLFLDEIGDLSGRVQGKLLRALEEGVIERVGGETEQRVDVRFVAATNSPLEQAVHSRRFRSDLYHRISVFRIHVPPLRERQGDLPLLVNHFLAGLNERYGRRVVRLTPEALRLLEEYSWPGNVRELRNVLERVYVESRAEVIGRNAFAEWERERDSLIAGAWDVSLLDQQRMRGPVIIVPPAGALGWGSAAFGPSESDARGDESVRHPLAPFGPSAPRGPIDVPFTVDVSAPAPAPKKQELTAETIRQAFVRANGNVTRAARMLGVHKTTLYRNMTRLGLSREELERGGSE
ncbi:MAG: sigma-54 dependent transcriptional regulator [Candidatus Sumerlaeota bacterium]|nr:sigma-54 dependent transcriptional regulator [Candidatus Sumerlaeota bacterium]